MQQPVHDLAGYRVLYLSGAGCALVACVWAYLTHLALRAAYLAEERSHERRDGGGTTMVEVRNPTDITGSL